MADLVEDAIADIPHVETHLRIVDIGRYIHLHVYVIIPPNITETIDILKHDQIRQSIYDRVSREYPYLSLDVGFTMDRRWAAEQRSFRNSRNSCGCDRIRRD